MMMMFMMVRTVRHLGKTRKKVETTYTKMTKAIALGVPSTIPYEITNSPNRILILYGIPYMPYIVHTTPLYNSKGGTKQVPKKRKKRKKRRKKNTSKSNLSLSLSLSLSTGTLPIKPTAISPPDTLSHR